MAKQKKTPVALARRAALRGEAGEALSVLLQSASAGDASAAASAAELLAYLDRWPEVIAHAGALIANPFAVYAGNVFDDMVRLLARAARETGRWGEVEAVAVNARRQVSSALDANAMNFPDVKVQVTRKRLLTIIGALTDYAHSADGDGFLDLTQIFGVAVEPPDRANYDAAIAAKKNQPADRRFALAVVFKIDDEVARIFPELKVPVGFDKAVAFARIMAKNGAHEAAWTAIETSWPQWAPVDHAQLAPVELLTDPLLAPILTTARRASLIKTPRAVHLTG